MDIYFLPVLRARNASDSSPRDSGPACSRWLTGYGQTLAGTGGKASKDPSESGLHLPVLI